MKPKMGGNIDHTGEGYRVRHADGDAGHAGANDLGDQREIQSLPAHGAEAEKRCHHGHEPHRHPRRKERRGNAGGGAEKRQHHQHRHAPPVEQSVAHQAEADASGAAAGLTYRQQGGGEDQREERCPR